MFLNFPLMYREVSMRHIPLPLSNFLMTRSGLKPNFLRVNLCCEVRLGFVTRGGKLGRGSWVCLRNSVNPSPHAFFHMLIIAVPKVF